jgi:hypothetical protein
MFLCFVVVCISADSVFDPWLLIQLLSPGVTRQEREADHPPQLVPRSREFGSIHPLPHTPSRRTFNQLSTEKTLLFCSSSSSSSSISSRVVAHTTVMTEWSVTVALYLGGFLFIV